MGSSHEDSPGHCVTRVCAKTCTCLSKGSDGSLLEAPSLSLSSLTERGPFIEEEKRHYGVRVSGVYTDEEGLCIRVYRTYVSLRLCVEAYFNIRSDTIIS